MLPLQGALVSVVARGWWPCGRGAWVSPVLEPHTPALLGASSAQPLRGHSGAAFPNPPSLHRWPGPAGLQHGPYTGPDPGPHARCRSWAMALARARAKESAQGQRGRICP